MADAIDQAFLIIFVVSILPLVAFSILGLIISFVMNLFQLQEASLTHLLKISLFMGLTFFFGSYVGDTLTDFMRTMFTS